MYDDFQMKWTGIPHFSPQGIWDLGTVGSKKVRAKTRSLTVPQRLPLRIRPDMVADVLTVCHERSHACRRKEQRPEPDVSSLRSEIASCSGPLRTLAQHLHRRVVHMLDGNSWRWKYSYLRYLATQPRTTPFLLGHSAFSGAVHHTCVATLKRIIVPGKHVQHVHNLPMTWLDNAICF